MATRSHTARQENLMSEAVVTDLAGQESPLLGLALEHFPNVRKRLAKNPQLLDILMPMVGGLLSKHDGGQPGQSGGSTDVASRIKGGS
ncbi:unnamed protein product [marine sediment metagenome]|uniref:Uncharacterized protein n=1 Tax=marine sediment metagenome TaxID=412755 RepID=X1LMA1_9ZZZZ